MRYLCLVYGDEKKLGILPESPGDCECLAYDEELYRSGHLITGNALESVQTATTVRVRNGRAFVTDGPFAETREQLAGFILIAARDLNDAIRMASGIPWARVGCVEVRPVRELSPR